MAAAGDVVLELRASASYCRFSRTSRTTMTGTRTMMNQAPSVNFVTAMMMRDDAGGDGAERR